MSNPVVTVGNSIPQPNDPTVVRKTYSRIVYSEQDFFIYSPGVDHTTFNPTNMGVRVFEMQRLKTSIPAQPVFVNDKTWISLQESASVFLTSRYSIMPKLMVPSAYLIDNGLLTTSQKYMGWDSFGHDTFNWTGTSANGAAINWNVDWADYAYIGGNHGGSLYVTTRWKDDGKTTGNSLVLELVNPINPPFTIPNPQWDKTALVVGGAFVMMLNISPNTSGAVSPIDDIQNKWNVKIELDGGDGIVLEISDGGALKATIGGGNNNTVTGNLAEGRAKESMPQMKYINEKEPYMIVVYPVWNGIIVMSGAQDSKGVINTASTFVSKWSEASILYGYSDEFDPQNPGDVKVRTTYSGMDTTVIFGNQITVTADNCRFDLAYQPCFFSRRGGFDEWFVGSDDTGTSTFDHNVYSIWTDNDTSFDLDAPTVSNSSHAGPVTNTTYKYIKWRMASDGSGNTNYLRYAGELFGSILEVIETRQYPIKNDNGHFILDWTGGVSPPGVSTDWKDYVQNIQVTIGDDGSSGSMTVDKYGIAGQDAVVIQSIGAITFDVTGGYNTHSGSIFKGLAMGVSDAVSAGNGTWTVPLIGLEKKLDDILLIDVPFMDGETLSTVMVFLAGYAGLVLDMSNADPNVTLTSSSDINLPRFDWKSGTSVRNAIDEVMINTLHTYVITDGKIKVYQLGNDGLPVHTGTDWSVGYTNYKIVSHDKTPIFDNLRNEIVVMALEQVPQGKGADMEAIPLFPLMNTMTQTTVPDIPWAMSIFQPMNGALTMAQLTTSMNRIASKSKVYTLAGSVTIPGNADIQVYDKWDSYVIKSVSHNLDLQAKTWTTSMELIS